MSLQTRIGDLITAIGTDMKQLRTWITGSSSGTLTGLTTTDKTNLVSAINEVNNKTATVPDATETVKGVVELATLAEVSTGTDAVRAVTPAGVRQERTALKNEILGSGTSAALDTLKEFQDAIGNDPSFAATTSTALGLRVRVDTSTQGLTTQQQTNARTNISAVGTAAIGDPETDLAALYATAKA